LKQWKKTIWIKREKTFIIFPPFISLMISKFSPRRKMWKSLKDTVFKFPPCKAGLKGGPFRVLPSVTKHFCSFAQRTSFFFKAFFSPHCISFPIFPLPCPFFRNLEPIPCTQALPFFPFIKLPPDYLVPSPFFSSVKRTFLDPPEVQGGVTSNTVSCVEDFCGFFNSGGLRFDRPFLSIKRLPRDPPFHLSPLRPFFSFPL